jgi:hypothetical protein
VGRRFGWLWGAYGIGGHESQPAPVPRGPRLTGLLAGWRHIWASPTLRPLFLNNVLVNALILAGEPPLTVLLLGRYGFPAWEYGLAFALPRLGGLVDTLAASAPPPFPYADQRAHGYADPSPAARPRQRHPPDR